MKIVVGSTNKAKIRAAQLAVDKLFPGTKVSGMEVDSGVSNQPKSAEESLQGAINRAENAMEKTKADYTIGMEGGMYKIGKRWFESGWIAVVDKKDKIGLGTSAHWQVSDKISRELLAGKELREVVTELSGKPNIYQEEGVMGLITSNHLPRDLAYSHGIIFAFGPFISEPIFWD